MALHARLSAAVMFVRDLDVSVDFYTDVLGLEVTDRAPTAALLVSAGGCQLALRSMGEQAERPLGSVGVQYVVWAAADEGGLKRIEEALKDRSAYRETRTGHGYTVVEGHDPDDVPVLAAYPGPDEVPLRKLPARIYGW
jgi:catechol 2,3-dioxygenase-like lactoylglutathione lyase family enzyme